LGFFGHEFGEDFKPIFHFDLKAASIDCINLADIYDEKVCPGGHDQSGYRAWILLL